MDKPHLPAAQRFIDEVRAVYAEKPDEASLWQRISDAMKPFLADPELKTSTRKWPLTIDGSTVKNLFFYEDPDYGFTFQATVRKPDLITSVHDHGDVWTLYGLIEGEETMYRYERTDGGGKDTGPATLELVATDRLGPGDIDVVPPGKIHQEHAGPVPSYAFIVRGQRSGTFKQHWYEPESGNVIVTDGPTLIPFAL
jgi:predicted metal-dependent enzyme (double-stranded beta helix superfamily)